MHSALQGILSILGQGGEPHGKLGSRVEDGETCWLGEPGMEHWIAQAKRRSTEPEPSTIHSFTVRHKLCVTL